MAAETPRIAIPADNLNERIHKRMKILVFIKQVPDTDDVKLDPRTGNLKREGVASIMNPLDANAIEAALGLKEKHGGSVTAITMGPPQAEEVLKRAVGMGCDDSILLSDRAFGGADTLATGYVLSRAAIKAGGYDLLLFGRHAVDAETAQTGPVVASFLDLPLVTMADSLEVENGWAFCIRSLEDKVQRVKVKLPAVITVSKEINMPRFPNVILALRKKPSTVWGCVELECDPTQVGISGSPSVTKRVVAPPKRNTDTKYLTGSDDEVVSSFVDLLEAEHLI